MATPDPFAPPSEEELALFGPPSPEELASLNPSHGGGPQGQRRTAAQQFNARPLSERAAIASINPEAWKGEAKVRGGIFAGSAHPEAVLSGITGGAGMLADTVTGADPGTHDWAYRPRTESGQAAEQAMGEVMAPIFAPQDSDSPLVQTLKERVPQFLGAAGTVAGAGALVNPVKNMGSKLLNPEPKPYTKAPVAEVAKTYTVVPRDVQHSMGPGAPVTPGIDITAPGVSVRGSTRSNLGPDVALSEVPVRNIAIGTREMTKDLPGQLLDANGRVDAGLLEGAIEHQTVPYKQVSQLPTPAANTLAERIRAAWNERGGSLKGDAVAESRLAPLMDAEGPPVPTAELLHRWRELNSYVSGLRKSSGEGSAAAQIKSGDLRSIADAILDEIDARAAESGNPQLVASLKEARTNIARLHALDDALDSVGWLDPDKLLAMHDAHVPLSGGLAEVAAAVRAAPESFTKMAKAIGAEGNTIDKYGRTMPSWARVQIGNLFGNKLARRGINSLNRELRAGSGLLKQPTTPPVVPPLLARPEPPPPPPPSAPPGMFADDIPAPRTPAMPSAGRPEPGGPTFNTLLADQMAGDLQLEGALPPPPAPRLPQSRPLDTVDFTRPEPPGAPVTRSAPPPSDPVGTVDRMSYEGQPRPFAEALNPDLIPWEPPGKVDQLRGPTSSFADQLGPVAPRLDESLAGDLGMPVPPRGINEAQLSSPVMPRDLRVASGPMDQPQVSEAARRIADMRRPKPRFGPDDEFPGAAPPVEPQGPAPSGGEGGIADMLYRGVPEGADPMAPNARGFTTWAPDRPTAERYGPTVGEAPFDPSTNVHLGTLEDARMLLGLGPEATAQDIAEAAMRRFGGANKTASYDLPPELGGTPREFIRFDNQ